MKIGSFNVKDNYINSHGGFRKDGSSNADIVANIILNEEFDFLGTQELTINYVNEIALRLNNYKFYGNYRYGNLLTKLPYNENNNIITRKEVVFDETVWLPWVANNIKDFTKSIITLSMMPRIATVIVANDEEFGQICMINTHLDYLNPSIQKRQLAELKQLIGKYNSKYPVILTGDFNMEPGNKNFSEFIENLQEQSLMHVDIEGHTWHNSTGKKRMLDHIFIPNYWCVEDAGIISSQGTSDHDFVYVKCKKK